MGHNINYNEQTGKYSFYSLKEKAWHSFGQISQQKLSSREVMEASQLNYRVEMAPHIYRFPSGNEIISSDTFYTYRTDTEQILGDGLSADYNMLQNADAFAFFDEIVKGEGVIYETAGALGKGEKIFITAKLPKYIKVGNEDIIEQYLFLTTSHDGKESITIAFTPVRIVCNNTLNAALNNCSNVVRIKHNTSLEQQLKEVPTIMGMVNTLNPIMEQAFNQFAKVKMTDKQVQRLIQIALAPNKETLDNIRDGREEENSPTYKNQVYSAFGYSMMADSQQLDTTKGTVFGAYNGITGYFHNVRNYSSDEDKINSLLCGGTAQKKGQRAFDLCMEFVKHGENALLLN
jgi:phage/plasmid-like protein (TIGR03299 family)